MNTSNHPANDTWQFTALNESATELLATGLADVLEPGTVVALVGNLGAGKTRLVQSVAEAMGVDRREVISPTFVLIQEYETRIPIYHFDAYRLRDTDEFLELGADEILDSDGICLIEWADRVDGVLPGDLLRIEIEATGETSRLFRFSSSGAKSSRVLKGLRDKIDVP